ncbi:GNAT family N-acetyltransferase [Janibacter alkaliphilus]
MSTPDDAPVTDAPVTGDPVTVRPARPDEAPSLVDLDDLVWAESERLPREVRLRSVPTRTVLVATREGETAGVTGAWDVEVGVPDGRGRARLVPADGVTWVGVHPDHTRRGVLTALIGSQLPATREAGRALSVLKASDSGIYGRFGYGTASTVLRASFAGGTTFAAPPEIQELADATRTRLQTAGPDLAPRLHAAWRRAATDRAGEVVRTEADLTRNLTDVPEHRGDREPNRVLVATRDDEVVGFAVVRRTVTEEGSVLGGRADVPIVTTADAAARLALAQRLTRLDLVTRTDWWVPADDPLVLWQPGWPRSLADGVVDSLWLRLVDLPAAVALRGTAADLDVVVEVPDPVLPENAGTWRWTARSGEGRLERSGEQAQLSVDVGDLASVWLGGRSLGALAVAGRVREHAPGAVARLDAALRTPVLPAQSVDF